MLSGKPKRDYKHGVAPRGTSFISSSGVEASSRAVLFQQIKDRANELYGKSPQSQSDRLLGLPTHVEQIQNSIGIRRDDNLTTDYEREIISVLIKSTKGAALSVPMKIPPIAIVFPRINQILIMANSMRGLRFDLSEFSPAQLDDQVRCWRLTGRLMGDGYLQFAEYRNVKYLTLESPLLRDPRFGSVSIFFRDQLDFGD